MQIEDFDAKGFVVLTDKTLLWDRDKGLKFKTPSGKIELVSPLLESAGFPAFPPYQPVPGRKTVTSSCWWGAPRPIPTSPPRTISI